MQLRINYLSIRQCQFYATFIMFIYSLLYIYQNKVFFTKYIFTNRLAIQNIDNLNSLNQQIITKVKSGDTILSILRNQQIDHKDIQQIISALKSCYDLRKLYINQKIVFEFDLSAENKRLKFLQLNINHHSNVELSLNEYDEYKAKIIDIPLKKYVTKITGTIKDSFLATATNLGIPRESLNELIKAYSYDVDFQREIKPGNKISVLMEKYYDQDGKLSHNGSVLYASLTMNNKSVNLYKYKNNTGETNYYNDKGDSIRKELLRTPLNVIRISSHFGIRQHPILNYSKMHKGIDFAAPFGTPIFAAGHGVVEEIGNKGAYGNYIKIKHNNNYSTAYAHASSFAKTLKKGTKVKQGEIIAYVGSTGRSTGPHLHYELIESGKQINPLKIKLSSNHNLSGIELNKFNKFKSHLDQLINTNLEAQLQIDNS